MTKQTEIVTGGNVSGDAAIAAAGGVITPEVSIDNFEKVFCQTLKAVTGLDVVNERNPGPQYPGSYASLRTFDGENQAYPVIDYEDVPADGDEPEKLNETIIDKIYLKAQIKIVGKNAFSKLSRFCTLLNSANRFKDLFAIAGLGGVDSVQNISVTENGRIQEQAVVNTYWYVAIEQTTDIDYFDKAQVPVKDYDENLTIPKEI